LSSKPDPNPDPKLSPKPDLYPKKIILDPQLIGAVVKNIFKYQNSGTAK
jgi:hypothetical protein